MLKSKVMFPGNPDTYVGGFAVGFVLISLHPRNSSFLQNLISDCCPVFGKGEKRAYCVFVHQRMSYVMTVGCFSPMGAVQVWDWCSHGLCQWCKTKLQMLLEFTWSHLLTRSSGVCVELLHVQCLDSEKATAGVKYCSQAVRIFCCVTWWGFFTPLCSKLWAFQ